MQATRVCQVSISYKIESAFKRFPYIPLHKAFRLPDSYREYFSYY